MNAPQPRHATQPSSIAEVTCRQIFIPFKEVVRWSAGTRPGVTRLVVEVRTEDGLIGVGETICLWEFVMPVFVKTIIPLVVGEDAYAIERILRKCEGAGFYHHQRALMAARAGLEMALWDQLGKRAGMPLNRLWGGPFRAQVPMVAYLQSADRAGLAEQAAAAVAQGFRTIKVKLGIGFEDDIAVVAAVRAAVGPTTRIRGDANGAWTMATAKRQLRALEKYDLEYVEQPLPLEDLAGAAELRRQVSTPIALDESVFTLADVSNAICQRAADVLVLDPLKAGGLLPARKAAAVAEAAGIPVTLHSGGEAGVGLAACLHLASTFPNLLFDVDCQYPNLATDIISTPFAFAPLMAPPSGPGLGVELSRGAVHRLTTDHIRDPYLDPTRPEWFPCKPQY